MGWEGFAARWGGRGSLLDGEEGVTAQWSGRGHCSMGREGFTTHAAHLINLECVLK